MNINTIRKVAVLGGSGVMGRQIAAHCVNANIPVILFDLPSEGARPNLLIEKGIQDLLQLKPAPLVTADRAAFIKAANYRDDLNLLLSCDLIIEAITERFDIKQDLFKKIAPFIHDNAILATNTSGLSIQALAQQLPSQCQSRFLGVHFFNPPRYMPLVELIPSQFTDTEILNQLETLLVTYFGKTIVRAKDTPNFIANRIGVFSLLMTAYHAEKFGIPFDTVDALTGELMGRPKSATFRTIDVVGLDTMSHVISTMASIKSDPWLQYFVEPTWLKQLIEKGSLGQKTGKGIYLKQGQTITVFDPKTLNYIPATYAVDAEVVDIIKKNTLSSALLLLSQSASPQAQFLWSCFRDLFHYCAYFLPEIADNARDIDIALRAGFGWRQGIFEIWQSAGFTAVRDAIGNDISQNRSASSAPLPNWLFDIHDFYQAGASIQPQTATYVKANQLPVYQRQLFSDEVITQTVAQGKTLYENKGVRLWEVNDKGVGILSFRSKNNVIGSAVIEGIIEAVSVAEKNCQALVLWQFDPTTFSLGANLKEFAPQFASSTEAEIAAAVKRFQDAALSLKYATIPTVAAIRGRVLGGGVELILHCDAAVAAFESYCGLVEVGVGFIPAGGGCKVLAEKAENDFSQLQNYFQQIAMAKVGSSAQESALFAYLPDDHQIIPHIHEVLTVAIEKALALAASAYRPPLQPQIKIQGRQGIANLQALLVNMREGHFITPYEYQLGSGLAAALCGGNIDSGAIVDEAWILREEREIFARFAKDERTQARIKHILETGKPLRN